jgi:hypothetical protein
VPTFWLTGRINGYTFRAVAVSSPRALVDASLIRLRRPQIKPSLSFVLTMALLFIEYNERT